MDKTALISAIVKTLNSNRDVLMAAAKGSRDEATDQDSRQEGKFDMRAQSAAYVAEGQARLVAELTEAIAAYRNLALSQDAGPVAVGSVVTVESQGEETVYFIGPARGGMDVKVGGIAVTVITASSPLGRLLAGRGAGESVAMERGRSRQTLLLLKVE